MTHRQKVDCLIAELSKRGISRSTVAPPLFRLLWMLGLEVPPPLFLGFVPLLLLTGPLFGVFWGAFMWLVQWRLWQVPAGMALVVVSALFGIFSGLSLAGYYRWKAAKLQLPSWDRYPEA